MRVSTRIRIRNIKQRLKSIEKNGLTEEQEKQAELIRKDLVAINRHYQGAKH